MCLWLLAAGLWSQGPVQESRLLSATTRGRRGQGTSIPHKWRKALIEGAPAPLLRRPRFCVSAPSMSGVSANNHYRASGGGGGGAGGDRHSNSSDHHSNHSSTSTMGTTSATTPSSTSPPQRRRCRHPPSCVATAAIVALVGSGFCLPPMVEGLLSNTCDLGPNIRHVITGTAEITVNSASAKNASSDGTNSLALRFTAGDDFSEVARRFVSSAGLAHGGGCETSACVESLVWELIESEALRLPAFDPPLPSPTTNSSSTTSVRPYTALADGCLHVRGPQSGPPDPPSPPVSSWSAASSSLSCDSRYMLSLLDEAPPLLHCSSSPSFYVHHYYYHHHHHASTTRPGSEDDSKQGSRPATSDHYPRLCHLGPSFYGPCACVLLDSIMAHILLLINHPANSSSSRTGDRMVLMTTVKDLASLLTAISGATDLSLAPSSLDLRLVSLAARLFEVVLSDYPLDTEARLLAGNNRLLLGHADQAALHYSILVPPPSLPTTTATQRQHDLHDDDEREGQAGEVLLRGFFRVAAQGAGSRHRRRNGGGGGGEDDDKAGARRLEVSLLKLVHDGQQLDWLLGRGLLPQVPYRQVADEYHRLAAHLRGLEGEGPNRSWAGEEGGGEKTSQYSHEVSVSASRYPLVAATYSTAVHVAPTPASPEGALSGHWDGGAVEAEFWARGEVAVVDDALTGAALKGLLELCRDSTVFHEARANGYLGAYADVTGFASGLLLQVALELPKRLPSILGHHRIRRVWAYKYDQNHTGISPHADDSSVTVNCWVTPDDALLETGRGGMAMFTDLKIPTDWTHDQYVDPAQVVTRTRTTIGGGEKTGNNSRALPVIVSSRDACLSGVTSLLLSHPTAMASALLVPYRQNRCVVFRSAIVHQSDNVLPFRPGYANRRINLTFLYGQMHTR